MEKPTLSPDSAKEESSSSTTTFGRLTTRAFITNKHVAWSLLAFLAIGFGVAQLFVPAKFFIFAIMLIAGILYTLTKPYLGLLLYYFVLVLKPAEMWSKLETLGLERLFGGFLFASFILVSLMLYRRVRVVTHNIYWAILLFFAVQILSLLVSVNPELTQDHVIDYFKNIAFVTMMIHIVDTPERFRGFIWFHVILMAYIAVSSLIAYMSGNVIVAQGITRIKSLTSAAGDPNALAATMDIALPFVFLLMGREKNWGLKLILLIFGGAMVYAVVLSGSRGGMMGLITMFILLWLMAKRKVVTGVAVIAAAALLITVMPAQYVGRYITVAKFAEEGNIDESSQERLDSWKAGREMFWDHPILGVGAGAYGWAHGTMYSPKFRPTYLKAHSMYFQIIGELGVVGVVSFGFLVGSIFFYNFRLRRKLKALGPEGEFMRRISYAIVIATLTLFVTAIFAHSLYRMYWLFAGALTIIMLRIVDQGLVGEKPASETGRPVATIRS